MLLSYRGEGGGIQPLRSEDLGYDHHSRGGLVKSIGAQNRRPKQKNVPRHKVLRDKTSYSNYQVFKNTF